METVDDETVAAAIDFVADAPEDASLVITITGDEEGDATDGTIAILDWMEAEGEVITDCIVGEPTCPNVMGEMMKIGRRGSMTAFFTAKGVQGHAAYPHTCRDPMVTAMHIGLALQTIAARNVDPLDPIVVSVTKFHGGTASNIIADEIRLSGTVRSFSEQNRDLAERRIHEIAAAQAASFEMTAEVVYERSYPATVNHALQVEKSARVAREVVGDDLVITDLAPEMGAEDFSYMLNERPGAFYFIGQGIGPSVHHPAFDFNDDIAPIGANVFARFDASHFDLTAAPHGAAVL